MVWNSSSPRIRIHGARAGSGRRVRLWRTTARHGSGSRHRRPLARSLGVLLLIAGTAGVLTAGCLLTAYWMLRPIYAAMP